MLFGYLLLSYLISAIGFLLYHFLLRKKGSPTQRKIYLYTILIVSLLLPYPLLKHVTTTESRNFLHEFHQEDVSPGENTIAFSELNACYQKAISEKEFCDCEDLKLNNIIVFQEDQFLETCLNCKSYVSSFACFLVAFILFILMIRVVYLVFIINTSEKSRIFIENQQYTILSNPKMPLAASFRLLKKYIIWDPSLNALAQKEQKAVYYHEIAHLNNLDTWEQIWLSILKMFWFPNPVFYKIRNELRLISEYLADAFAVSKTGNPQNYASLLIRLKEQQHMGLYQGFGSEDLKSRIVHIIQPSNKNKGSFLSLIFSSFLLMASTGILAAPPIKTQMKTLQQYELLQNKKSETGKNYFCKACILEELEASSNFD